MRNLNGWHAHEMEEEIHAKQHYLAIIQIILVF